jgi:site-specific DNA-cytosine methylase
LNEKIICEERTDEGIRFFKDGCCGTIRTIEAGGDKRVIEINRLGNIYGEDKGTGYAGNVWDDKGLCPTITTMQGGNREPMIVASRGRNKGNPSDRTQGIELEQRLEPNSEGICNTLTSVQKDNLVLEPAILTPKRTEYGKAIRKDYENGKIQESRHNMTELQPRSDGISNTLTTVQKDNLVLEPKLVGGLGEKDWGKQWRQGNRVYDSEAIAMALQAQPVGNAGGNSYLYKTDYRIRKLTPKECAKLMKFSDEDANKMLEVNSNTQVYKQCGNSIVVSVLEAIFCQMNIKGCPTWEERAKEEYL